MPENKRVHPTIKLNLHPRNKHKARYDFKALTHTLPALKAFVFINKFGDESIDFFDPKAVMMLNKALLKHFYQIDNWEVPEHYLCPPIPGRADYIHYIADLISVTNGENKKQINCLDIGVGANCIYPIIGHQEYGWSFVGSDVDPVAIQAAQETINANPQLKAHIFLRLQTNTRNIFTDIIHGGEYYDVSICNPPFHASAKEANASSLRKLSNLKGEKVKKAVLNFGGQSNELWYAGGELKFMTNMIYESRRFGKQCRWFTSLVSKEANLTQIYKLLDVVNAKSIKTIEMSQGNKISRIVAWSFG